MQINSKPMYQPWNEEEFMSDIFVRNMKPVERWMYRTLLQSMFFHSTRPFIPTDDDTLWMLAGCETKDQWLAHKSVVLNRFSTVDGEPELLQNKRVNEDWKRLMKVRKRYSNMGKASAAKRSTQAQPTFNPGSTREVKGSEGKGSGVKSRAASASSSHVFDTPEEV
jgi:uncharacterized protein YdaU (DUF1376 family)